MKHRILISLAMPAALAFASVAQAAPRASVPSVDAAQPLCGGNGTKTPPDGPAPPKEPPKT